MLAIPVFLVLLDCRVKFGDLMIIAVEVVAGLAQEEPFKLFGAASVFGYLCSDKFDAFLDGFKVFSDLLLESFNVSEISEHLFRLVGWIV